MKNIKDLGENVAIQCKTQEEWDWVTNELEKKWTYGSWGSFRENTIIHSDRPLYGDVNLTPLPIVQASDFMPLDPQQEIKELKERLAVLEESLLLKKKIEFVRHLTVDMSIFEKINDCPHNMVDILELRTPVADYLDAIIGLYSREIIDAENADKIMLEVKTAFKIRVQQIRNSLLN